MLERRDKWNEHPLHVTQSSCLDGQVHGQAGAIKLSRVTKTFNVIVGVDHSFRFEMKGVFNYAGAFHLQYCSHLQRLLSRISLTIRIRCDVHPGSRGRSTTAL